MPRSPRAAVLTRGGVYHITTRGNNGGPIYLEDDDRHLFLNFFRKIRRRLGWICHEWCLMTTHYHLLLTAPEPDLPVGMHWLNGVYAQTFNDRYGRTGHLFERRYGARLVDSDEYFAAALDYIRWNPVVAGLCDHPSQWRWRGPDRIGPPNTASKDYVKGGDTGSGGWATMSIQPGRGEFCSNASPNGPAKSSSSPRTRQGR